MAFPDEPLDLRMELYLGELLGWVDITGDVYTRDPVSITRGRRDEASRVDPGKCSLTLNNRAGKYSPRNPRSPYFGLLGRNTPIRVSLPGPESYLSLDGSPTGQASTPDTAALNITGDLDVRVEASIDWHDTDTRQLLAGQYDPSTDDRAWLLWLNTGHRLQLTWSENGSDTRFASYLLPTTVPERAAVRVTLDTVSEVGSVSVRFYWAPSLDGPWEHFGTVEGGNPTSVHASGAALQIAPAYAIDSVPRNPAVGQVHRAEVRNGIDGPVVAAPDFRDLDPGTGAFTDAAGLPWTIEGSAHVSNRAYRFHGEVSEWPQRWDTSGNDVYVPITASGVMRRMGQGAPTLQSTLRRRIPGGGDGQPAPLVYWPMEEGKYATQAASPLPGVEPLRTSGLQWAANDTLFGSDALPTLGQSASISGRLPHVARGAGWTVDLSYLLEKLPDSPEQILRVHLAGSPAVYVEATASTAGIRVAAYDREGVLLNEATSDSPTSLESFVGSWNRIQLAAAVVGDQAWFDVSWRNVITGSVFSWATAIIGEPGAPTRVTADWGQGLTGMAVGHLGVWDVPLDASDDPVVTNRAITYFDDADDGFEGEFAFNRMVRLAAEENLTIFLEDGPGSTEQLGPQRVQSLLDLLEEAAAADGGLLYEHRRTPNLAARFRASLYNQPVALTLDYASGREVAPPLEPTDDDQGVANEVEVKREGGSSGRAVLTEGALSNQPPPAGIGPVNESVTLNLADDDQTEPMAHWRLHLGTVDEARYPTVHVWLHAAPHLIDQVLALDVLDRVQILNPPEWLPPGTIDLLAEGYTETFGWNTWDLTLNCSPGSPWVLGEVADGTAEDGPDEPTRVDTDGSELASAAGAADTELRVRATEGPAWTSDPGEAPFDVRVGGEVVRVTAVTDGAAKVMPGAGDGSTTSAFAHVAPSVDAVGSADLLVCAWIPWAQPGPYTVPASMTVQAQTSGSWATLADATEQLAAAGPTGTRTATRATSNQWAAISVLVSGAPDSTPVIAEHLEGYAVSPDPVSFTTGTVAAGSWLLAIQGWDNNALAALATPSGVGWQLVTDSLADSNAPYLAVWAKQVDAAGVQEVSVPAGTADDNHARLYVLTGVTDLTAQAFTVTRSVNGISKPHQAGTDVRLAQPAIVAL